MKLEKKLAPIALFVYNRLKNTRQVVEALQKNHLAPKTELYIFSDGPKDEYVEYSVAKVREYLKTISGFQQIHIIERSTNYYIERNIIEGVTEVVNKHGQIIVMEDDGVTTPNFLTFMNEALEYYEQEKRVMHIATFTFIPNPSPEHKAFFWRYTENTGGGWATWKDRWDEFKWYQSEAEALRDIDEATMTWLTMNGIYKALGSLKMSPIPWDICWYIALGKKRGLAVQSPTALTVNNGLYNGTHLNFITRLGGKSDFETTLDTSEHKIILDGKIEENKIALASLQDFYTNLHTGLRRKIVDILLFPLVKLRITYAIKLLLKRLRLM